MKKIVTINGKEIEVENLEGTNVWIDKESDVDINSNASGVEGECLIIRSKVEYSEIKNSTIIDSQVIESKVSNCHLDSCSLSDSTLIFVNAFNRAFYGDAFKGIAFPPICDAEKYASVHLQFIGDLNVYLCNKGYIEVGFFNEYGAEFMNLDEFNKYADDTFCKSYADALKSAVSSFAAIIDAAEEQSEFEDDNE